MEEFLTVKEIVNNFNLKVIVGDKASLKRKITTPDVNRPGLELSGFFHHTESKRVMIMGDKEETYFNQLDEKRQLEIAKLLLSELTPCIILTNNRECPKVIYNVAKENNFPILTSEFRSTRVMIDVITFLDEKLAPNGNIHGVLMTIYGIGVLITGDSGVGKSETALELIQKGHILIADDRVDVIRAHNSIIGFAPQILRGMLEIRGIGIIDVDKMYGATSSLEKIALDMVIKLEKFTDSINFDRVGIYEKEQMTILDMPIPITKIPVSEGRNVATLIESAVRNFKLKSNGYDSAKEFEKRVIANIKRQQENEGENE